VARVSSPTIIEELANLSLSCFVVWLFGHTQRLTVWTSVKLKSACCQRWASAILVCNSPRLRTAESLAEFLTNITVAELTLLAKKVGLPQWCSHYGVDSCVSHRVNFLPCLFLHILTTSLGPSYLKRMWNYHPQIADLKLLQRKLQLRNCTCGATFFLQLRLWKCFLQIAELRLRTTKKLLTRMRLVC
jgi:hypothetical protein